MSRATRRGLIVAVLHVLLVASLGGKLLADRAMRPRVWVRTAPVDPNLPIRGRYVRLRIEAVPGPGLTINAPTVFVPVSLSVQNDRLVALPASDSNELGARTFDRRGERVLALDQPLAYFIPEHVPDPSRRGEGEELWVEVTVPARGAPRPIRLGVKKDGVLTPLDVN